jgi:tRNA(Ile)-lysidine synthase
VAVSGGQDSLALLHCLHDLREELGVALHVAHLHHGIRGEEADDDAGFVTESCAGLGIPIEVGHASVPDLAREHQQSLEQAGREARRAFLRETACAHACSKIALGHTATDRAETVVMNILRGTGLEGLRGIPPVNGSTIRPLILATREQTAAYCATHDLHPRLDRTNLDTDAHLRNRIRLQLIPLLDVEYAPGIRDALLRLADTATAELAWTETLVEEAFAGAASRSGDVLCLRLAALADMPRGLLGRVLRRALSDMAGALTGFELAHIEVLADLAQHGRTGAELSLPFELRARREYNALVLEPARRDDSQLQGWEVTLVIPGEALLPTGGHLRAELVSCPDVGQAVLSASDAFLDLCATGPALTVRSWRHGDCIAPLGMAGTKKLQDVFVDEKVPRGQRHRIPVVTNSAGDVLWVAGLCLSRLAAVSRGGQASVCLQWTPCHADAG